MKKCLILNLFCLFIAGCATISSNSMYREAMSLKDKGNLEQAYLAIKEAYSKNPNNEKIKTTLEKIKGDLVNKYCAEANNITSYNLTQKKLILQKALEINNQDETVKKRIEEIDQEIENINEEVTTLLNNQDTLLVFKKYLTLKEYEPYFESVKQLKGKLFALKDALSIKIGEVENNGKEDEAVGLAVAAESIFKDTQEFKNKKESLLAKKANQAIILSKQYSSLENQDRSATALVYLIMAYNYYDKIPDLIDEINRKFDNFKKEFSPVLIVELSDNFSSKQKEEIMSDLATYEDSELDLDILGKNDNHILINLNLEDLSIDQKVFQSGKYSKYFAGYQSVPNPNYNNLLVQYNQAQFNAQNYTQQYYYNPNLGTAIAKGLQDSAVNLLAAQLARTPPFIQQPVYQDYQYEQIDVNYSLNMKIKYKLIQPLSQLQLNKGCFDRSGSEKRTAINGAHPQDYKNIRNCSIPSSESESILREFSTQNFEELSKFIVYDLVGEINLFLGKLGLERNNYSEVIDKIFSYKLYNISLENGLIKGKLTVEEIKKFVQSLNLPNIQDDLNNLSLSEIESLNLSITNMFKNSFVNDSFLSGDLNIFKETFSQFNPEIFEYKEDASSLFNNMMQQPIDKTIKDAEEKTSKQQAANVIEECLNSVVVIETPQGIGSGFVINSKGYIITNYHVITSQDSIMVKWSDGRKGFADLISLAKFKDLALLKINEKNMKPLKIGNINKVKIGDTVFALGAPGGAGDTVLDKTVTKGIVSSIRLLEAPYNPSEKIEFIQTDAALNPGNSGGPLINEEGEVIGVNSQKIANVAVEGINFSISIEEVKKSFAEYLK